MNNDCSRDKACLNSKCRDPCPGVCGFNAECHVVNHSPACSCLPGYTGDPLQGCRNIPPPSKRLLSPALRFITYKTICIQEVHDPVDPCRPSPCGANSDCLVSHGNAVCSCRPSFIGSPPNCRPECVVSSECGQTLACVNMKCVDPCPGTCGYNARCQVINHNPICSCNAGYNGDPFVRCNLEQSKSMLSPFFL